MNAQWKAGLDACTRCGLCLQACPTYRVLHLEADSPRGRVFLMKEVADGEAAVGANLAEHLYACLGCRACETACPSGVPYGSLLEEGRRAVEEAGAIDPSRRRWRLFRRIAFTWLLPRKGLFEAFVAPARWLAKHPAMRRALERFFSNPRMRDALAMLPQSDRPKAALPGLVRGSGERRARVGLFVGCVMGSLFGEVHEALARVLRHNGCEIVVPKDQWCCGALNVHAGEQEYARDMARRNIAAFENADVDAVIVDSAGCGAMMKEYGTLLAGDPLFGGRAARFGERAKDALEFLAALDLKPDMGALPDRVTYQDACHLLHGQRVRAQPRNLMRAIPELELVEMDGADRCCGAAGVYSLTHPRLSSALLDEKVDAVAKTGAGVVAVANPGCHMQLLRGLRGRIPNVTVRHVVQLIDDAYAKGADPGRYAAAFD